MSLGRAAPRRRASPWARTENSTQSGWNSGRCGATFLKRDFLGGFPVFRIHVFLGLPDPDPLVRGMDPDPDPALDPDPSIIKQI